MRSVLITGASSGFGQNAALALAEAGWLVFASMRNLAGADRLLERATVAGFADRIRTLELDVGNAASVQCAVASVLSETGDLLDAVLNNAGYGVLGAFEDLSDSQCRQQMETNFFGTLSVTRAVLPCMRAAGKGRIVIITSNAVNAPHPMLTMYAASKWALEGWAEGLAMEVAPFGIEIAVIQPGAHRTPFGSKIVPVVPRGSAYARIMEAIAPGIAALDRWGRDPSHATLPLLSAIADPEVPFRTALGEDTVGFAMMKGALPYEARAWLLRALISAPGPNSFVSKETSPSHGNSIDAAIVSRLARALQEDQNLARDMIKAFVPDPTSRH